VLVHKHKHCECCVPVCGTHTRSSHAAHVNHMRNTLYVHARYLYVDCGHHYHCTIPLHDYHCTKKVADSSSSFIVQKEIIIQMLHVIILFVSSWQQSTTISFCISCFSSFGFSFTTARSWKKVIVIVEGWQFVRLVVLILETRLGTNTTYCSPDYAQNVATN